ncbi:hypothetical protein [Hyphomicrobium sp. 99]|uniref:hypothetical protein n=1 Tax=Hyphomicrobium sp. 99 TaxID=1163419 RepID=UPI0012DFEE40|nr:hypothetical protein [Hyphomicrobium sp. 99]
MKSFVAGLSVLFASFMALSAYSLNADWKSSAVGATAAPITADAAMTPDSGTSGTGYEP